MRNGLIFIISGLFAASCALDLVQEGLPPGGSETPGDPMTPSEAGDEMCPGATAVVTADGARWTSNEVSVAAFDTLQFEVKARPQAEAVDALVAVGSDDINTFSDAAILVRFAPSGIVDVRDGAEYVRDVDFVYEAGAWYDIVVTANVADRTYDVKVGQCGEPPQPVVAGAKFRSNAPLSDRLTTWGAWSSTEGLEVTTPMWLASGECAPSSCDSLGLECGQPSDGCGGTLNCGGCDSGESCDSGECVAEATPEPPPPPTPSEPTVPVEPSSPSPGGWPDRPWANNTGPSNPGALKSSGSITVTQNGAVLENLDVSGLITIDADNVTVRNFRIITSGSYGVYIKPGHSGIVLEDGEIANISSAGILGMGFTARRIHIHDSGGDGIKPQGSGGPVLVEQSFIEKIGKLPEAHADGVQARGGSNITFRHNNIYMPHPGTPEFPGAPYKSNATFLTQTTVNNFVIDSNWLTGGGYTVHCLDTGGSGTFVRNNIIGRYNGGWPEKEEKRVRNGGCSEWSNNRWEDTGALIP